MILPAIVAGICIGSGVALLINAEDMMRAATGLVLILAGLVWMIPAIWS